jgi:uncharacterized protein (DUF1499 family)
MSIRSELLPWEQIFMLSALGLLIMALTNLIALIRRRRIGTARRLALALFAVGAMLPWLLQPHFGARFQRAGATNIAATSEQTEWPELKPRRYPRSVTEVAQAIPQAIEQLGWRLAGQDGTTFAAEVPVAGGMFTDDLRVMLTEADQQTVVNVHSRSRVGRGDLGENRRHVLQFLIVLEQQLNVQPQR